MPKNYFVDAEKERIRLTNAQVKSISKMYSDLARDVGKQAIRLKSRDNISSILRSKYLEDMAKDLSDSVESINFAIEKGIKSNMIKAAEAVVNDNKKLLYTMGLKLDSAYSFVPNDVVETLISGKMYKEKWTLSARIWSDSKKKLDDINYVVSKGVAANKSSFEIAKDLQKYVDPKAAKQWDWSKVYPGVHKKIDYNAQRLARTMVGQAYQQSFVQMTKDNPFFNSYKWLISNSDRVCPICIARATNDIYGLGPGIYPKNALPMDHPNGMCTWIVNVSKNYNSITDELAAWVKGEENEDLDKFANSLLGTNRSSKSINTVKQVAKIASKQNLENISLDKAYEDWFEYENADLMKEFSETGKMSTTNILEEKVSLSKQKLLKAETNKLQQAAENMQTNKKAVYRGMVIEDVSEFENAIGNTYKFDSLTAASDSLKLAKTYSDPDYFGQEGTPVIMHIENPKGVIGYDSKQGEIIIPKGAEYKISRAFYDEDYVLNVFLYKSIKLKR